MYTFANDLLFTDALYDVGKSGATRPRDGFFSRDVVVGRNLTPGTVVADMLFTDALYDIGKSGATRPRDGFFSRDIVVGRNLTPGTIVADVLFTDALYDIGKSGATRPRDGFFSRDVVVGRNLTPGTVVADILFTDALYDIGKSGATRPRDIFLSRNLTIGGTVTGSGLFTITASGTHAFSGSPTGIQRFQVVNTAAGTTNSGEVLVSGDTTNSTIGHTSSNFTTSGPKQANGAYWVCSAAGGIAIAATHASGGIDFYATGTTRIARLNGNSFTFDGAGGTFLHNTLGIQTGTWPTTASAANAVVGDADYLRRSTSLLAYKFDVQPLKNAEAIQIVKALRPVLYRSRIDDDKRQWPGFIADWMRADAPLLTTYDKTGKADGVAYDRVSAYLTAVVQDHETRLLALEGTHGQ